MIPLKQREGKQFTIKTQGRRTSKQFIVFSVRSVTQRTHRRIMKFRGVCRRWWNWDGLAVNISPKQTLMFLLMSLIPNHFLKLACVKSISNSAHLCWYPQLLKTSTSDLNGKFSDSSFLSHPALQNLLSLKIYLRNRLISDWLFTSSYKHKGCWTPVLCCVMFLKLP